MLLTRLEPPASARFALLAAAILASYGCQPGPSPLADTAADARPEAETDASTVDTATADIATMDPARADIATADTVEPSDAPPPRDAPPPDDGPPFGLDWDPPTTVPGLLAE